MRLRETPAGMKESEQFASNRRKGGRRSVTAPAPLRLAPQPAPLPDPSPPSRLGSEEGRGGGGACPAPPLDPSLTLGERKGKEEERARRPAPLPDPSPSLRPPRHSWSAPPRARERVVMDQMVKDY